MKYARLPGIEKDLSAICLGAADYGSGISPSDSFRLLDRFVELGGTFIDTAHVYGAWDTSGYNGGYGNSEKVIGEWLTNSGMENKVAAATKGAHPDLDTGVGRMSPEAIDAHVSESLERLRTDFIDLYWVHTDEPSIPAGEILGMLAEQMSAGLIRSVGCANWSIERQREASSAALALGLPGFVASQVGWSFATTNQSVYRPRNVDMRYMDSEMLRHHEETGSPVAAYSAQARGFFAAKYDGLDFDSSEFPNPGLLARYGNDLNYCRRRVAGELAREKDCSANQVALAWMMRHPFGVFPIAGPNSLQQMDDTMRAGDIELTDSEFERVTCGHARGSVSPD